jgi:hypothetical protein
MSDAARDMLKCQCGQPVTRQNVIDQGYRLIWFFSWRFPRVFVKFRCSCCKKLGEHLVKEFR